MVRMYSRDELIAIDYDKEEEDQLDLEATEWDEGKIPLITAIDFGHFDIAKMLWNALPEKRGNFLSQTND